MYTYSRVVRVSYTWLRMVLAMSWTLDNYFSKKIQLKPPKTPELSSKFFYLLKNACSFVGFFFFFNSRDRNLARINLVI